MTRCHFTIPCSLCLSMGHCICISYIFRLTLTSLAIVTLHNSHRQHRASKLIHLERPDFPSSPKKSTVINNLRRLLRQRTSPKSWRVSLLRCCVAKSPRKSER
jgi:hypothetical protein